MPKLIVTSRYLKSGSKKKLANYVKYIAAREGSVPTEDKNEQAPAAKKQQELILGNTAQRLPNGFVRYCLYL